MSGRHLDPESGDGLQIVRLIASIVAIGLALFLILWLFTGGDDGDPEAASTVGGTSTEAGVSTTAPDGPTSSTTAATTSPSTTTTPPTTSAPTTTEDASTTTISARPPGEVTVVVLNAEGTAGLAGDTSTTLAELGYQMGPADDTELLDTSRIVHAPDFGAEAFVLAEEFPDAEVSEDAEVAEEWGADVVVILGASYQP